MKVARSFVLATVVCLALGTAPVHAQQINFQSATALAQRTLAGENTGQQAMDVSILVYPSNGGTPIVRGAHQNFFTGERFKLRIRASKSGTLNVVNVEQNGRQNQLSQAQVSVGQELIYPVAPNTFLEFDGNSGNEKLRLTLTPSGGTAPFNPFDTVPLPSPSGGLDDLLALLNGGGTSAPQPNYPPPGLVYPEQLPNYQPQTPQQPQPTGAGQYFGNAAGKAYVYGKGIREVVLEQPGSTQFVQPATGAGLFYEMTINHY